VTTQCRYLIIVTSSVNRYLTVAPPLVLSINPLSSTANRFLRWSVAPGMQIALHMADRNKDPRRAVAMFRLDYLSCFLTVVATILVGRKMWSGLVVSGVNSLIVCVIGLHTSQYGFIPANVFCICINAFNLRAWLKGQKEGKNFGDLRLAEGSGRPIGTADFVTGLERLLGRPIARRAPGRKPTASV
jgi:hypothetical protein